MLSGSPQIWLRLIVCVLVLCLATAPGSAERLKSPYRIWTFVSLHDVAACLEKRTKDYTQFDVELTERGLKFSIKKADQPAALIEIIDHVIRREIKVKPFDNVNYNRIRRIGFSCI